MGNTNRYLHLWERPRTDCLQARKMPTYNVKVQGRILDTRVRKAHFALCVCQRSLFTHFSSSPPRSHPLLPSSTQSEVMESWCRTLDKRKWHFNRFQLIDFLPLHGPLFIIFCHRRFLVAINVYHYFLIFTSTLKLVVWHSGYALKWMVTETDVRLGQTMPNTSCGGAGDNKQTTNPTNENSKRWRLCQLIFVSLFAPLSGNEWHHSAALNTSTYYIFYGISSFVFFVFATHFLASNLLHFECLFLLPFRQSQNSVSFRIVFRVHCNVAPKSNRLGWTSHVCMVSILPSRNGCSAVICTKKQKNNKQQIEPDECENIGTYGVADYNNKIFAEKENIHRSKWNCVSNLNLKKDLRHFEKYNNKFDCDELLPERKKATVWVCTVCVEGIGVDEFADWLTDWLTVWVVVGGIPGSRAGMSAHNIYIFLITIIHIPTPRSHSFIVIA